MSGTVPIVACGIFRKEVELLVRKNGWPLRPVFLDSSLHIHFDRLYRELGAALAGAPGNARVLYGACHPRIDALLAERGAVRTPGQNCVELLLGRERFDEETRSGAFFLIEDWARRFDEIVGKALGSKPELVREIFRTAHSSFLAIRTPCSNDFSADAARIGERFGLPVRWFDASLSHLEAAIAGILPPAPPAGREDAETERLKSRVRTLAQEKARLGLVSDLILRVGGVSGIDPVGTVILTTLMETIGGTHLALYVRLDEGLRRIGLDGSAAVVSHDDHPLVAEALETGKPVRRDEHARLVESLAGNVGSSYALPLKRGEEIVGCILIEGVMVGPESFRGGFHDQLAPFLSHAALALGSEVRSASRLQAAHDRYRNLFRSMRDAFALHEVVRDARDRVTDARFLEVNAPYAAMFGTEPESIIGRLVSEVVPALDPGTPLMAAFARVAETGEGVHFESPPMMDGRIFEVTAYSPGEGMFAVIFSDTTERRQLREQLLQAQKMEAIGRLAGGVAHDFNNLLTAIIGYADIARRATFAGRPVLEELVEIRKAGERAAAMTRQLLAFSRRQILSPQRVDVREAIAGLERMLRRLIGENIELSVRCAPGPLHVLIDPAQFDQVIVNLVLNARDAMPDGGRIDISAGRVETPGPAVVIEVRDTGHGMSAETLSQVFEPFFTTKEVGRGTGLGLATVHGIVHQSRGHIEAESEPGKGTAFRIRLPVAPPETERAEALSPVPERGRRSGRILVVEDEPAIRSLIAAILSGAGFEVIEAANGIEAVETAGKAGEIDLLVTDLVMPGMGGRRLREALLARMPSLRCLYISGYDRESESGEAPGGERCAFLQKPFAPDALLAAVDAILPQPTGSISPPATSDS